jgi:hypothetical protein
MRLLALSRGRLRDELFCRRHRCRPLDRSGYGDAGFFASRRRRRISVAFTPIAAVAAIAAAATAALALVIPFPRIRCPCLG